MRRCCCLMMLLWLCASGSFAQNSKDSLLKIIQANKRDHEQVRAYTAYASDLLRSEMGKAKQVVYEAIPLAIELKRPDALCGYYSILMTAHDNTANADSAAFYLEQMKIVAEKNSDDFKVQYNYHAAAGLYHKRQGSYTRAIPFLKKAAALSMRLNNVESTAGQYINIGNTYIEIGDYRGALQFHMQALKLFRQIGHERGISFCYQNISNNFLELGQYDKALEYSKLSLQLKEKLNDARGIGTSYATMAKIYSLKGDKATAKKFFTAALDRAEQLQLTKEAAKMKIELGKLSQERKDFTTAALYFTEGKKTALTAADTALSLTAGNLLLQLQSAAMEEKEKEQKLLDHLASTRRRGDRNDEAEVYRQLSDHYEEVQQPEMALEYLKLHFGLKDSLNSQQIRYDINALEQQYQTELKETEIALLKKEKQLSVVQLQKQRSIQYATLAFVFFLLVTGLLLFNRYRLINRTRRQQDIEKMRNRIAKDLHDDIGSTLSSIQITSKLLLQNQKRGVVDDQGLKKIHENASTIMDNMADIVWAINPHNDTVEKMLVRMKEFAAEVLDPLDISYQFIEEGNLSALKLNPQMRKDLYLIFKESVNNAAKYSGCTEVEIRISNQDSSLQLEVKDNGKGFEPALARKGNGLNNMKERSFEMNGSIRYFTRPGAGTSVKLQIPVT